MCRPPTSSPILLMSTKQSKTWVSSKTIVVLAITTSNIRCSSISPFMTQITALITMQHLWTKSIKINLWDMIHWAVTTTKPTPSNQISLNNPAFTLHVAITDTRALLKTTLQPRWWASRPTTQVIMSCRSLNSHMLSISNSNNNRIRRDPITQDKSLLRAHQWLWNRSRHSRTTTNSTNVSGRTPQATASRTK